MTTNNENNVKQIIGNACTFPLLVVWWPLPGRTEVILVNQNLQHHQQQVTTAHNINIKQKQQHSTRTATLEACLARLCWAIQASSRPLEDAHIHTCVYHWCVCNWEREREHNTENMSWAALVFLSLSRMNEDHQGGLAMMTHTTHRRTQTTILTMITHRHIGTLLALSISNHRAMKQMVSLLSSKKMWSSQKTWVHQMLMQYEHSTHKTAHSQQVHIQHLQRHERC